MSIEGGCLCGAVRFAFDEPPVAVRACWCRACRYLSSGNASVSAVFGTATFRLSGETAEHLSTADSGNTMRRRFCPNRGTQLFSESLNPPAFMVVRAGSLDELELARTESVIWTASAPSWGYLDPALPGGTGQPGPVGDE